MEPLAARPTDWTLATQCGSRCAANNTCAERSRRLVRLFARTRQKLSLFGLDLFVYENPWLFLVALPIAAVGYLVLDIALTWLICCRLMLTGDVIPLFRGLQTDLRGS